MSDKKADWIFYKQSINLSPKTDTTFGGVQSYAQTGIHESAQES